MSVFVADLPAKAAVLSHAQFNGKYGCTYCMQKGAVVEKGRGHTRIYEHAAEYEERTHRSILQNARIALYEHVCITLHIYIL